MRERITENLNHLLLKVAITDEQDRGEEANLDDESQPQIIIQVLYPVNVTPYFIFMFKNICQKFIYSDADLKNEFKKLTSITKNMEGNTKIIELQTE